LGNLILWFDFNDEVYNQYGSDLLEILMEKIDSFSDQNCLDIYKEVLVHFCRNEEDLQESIFELLTVGNGAREIIKISEFKSVTEEDKVLAGLLKKLCDKYGCDDILKENIDYISQ
jgi:hypothetical protein